MTPRGVPKVVDPCEWCSLAECVEGEPLCQSCLDSWANCSVPDCGWKIAHSSDKCWPHTHGEPTRRPSCRDCGEHIHVLYGGRCALCRGD